MFEITTYRLVKWMSTFNNEKKNYLNDNYSNYRKCLHLAS